VVGHWAEKNRIPYTTFVDLSQKEQVHKLIEQDLRRVNSNLPEGARVKKYVLLHKEFDADEAELTRTRKLRRGFMTERYGYLIRAIYDNKAEVEVEATVRYRDGQTANILTPLKVRTLD
jgi:long-chain acyl-CoA synthetase